MLGEAKTIVSKGVPDNADFVTRHPVHRVGCNSRIEVVGEDGKKLTLKCRQGSRRHKSDHLKLLRSGPLGKSEYVLIRWKSNQRVFSIVPLIEEERARQANKKDKDD